MAELVAVPGVLICSVDCRRAVLRYPSLLPDLRRLVAGLDARVPFVGQGCVRIAENQPMEQISLVVTAGADASVLLGVAEPATIAVAGGRAFGSVAALERALLRVGLPAWVARNTDCAMPLQVSLVQLSRLGLL